MLHKNLILSDRHAPHTYEYGNAGARTGATGFGAGDIGKLARQLDDNTLWMLTTTTPTWQSISGAGGGDRTYHHVQGTPSATWVIEHLFGKYPSVLVVDSGGSVVEGDITYDSNNQITLNFSAAFSGDAYLN